MNRVLSDRCQILKLMNLNVRTYIAKINGVSVHRNIVTVSTKCFHIYCTLLLWYCVSPIMITESMKPSIAIQTACSFATWKCTCVRTNDVTCSQLLCVYIHMYVLIYVACMHMYVQVCICMAHVYTTVPICTRTTPSEFE